MRIARLLLTILVSPVPAYPQSPASSTDSLSNLIVPHEYSQKRVSSYDRSGTNADSRPFPPGETLTLFDRPGPVLVITHPVVYAVVTGAGPP